MSDLLPLRLSFAVRGLLIVVSVILLAAAGVSAADPPAQPAIQREPQEIRLTASEEHSWWSFPAMMNFTHQATGKHLALEAYWDGGQEWVVRWAAPQPGIWAWESISDDAGLHGRTGRFEVRQPTKDETANNPNFRGHLKISDNGRYFEHADGTPLLLLADTLWSGNTARCGLGENQDGPFYQYLAERKSKGFSAILIKYLNGFDDGPANPTGERNEGGYTFLQRDCGHLLSIHPSSRLDWPPPHNCQSSRPFHESGWLDHHWLQTGQSIDRMHNIVTRTEENRALSPPRPVFCSEGYYDVSDDPDQAYHARWQAWVAILSGSAGYGYGAHGIWQFYDPADPKQETGKLDRRIVPWPQALQFDGSTMVQPVRSLLARFPWWQLEPHRDWLLVDGRPSPRPTATDLTPPHCAAISGQLYILYIPRGNAPRALKLTNLLGENYQGQWFDPRTGETSPIGDAAAVPNGWSIPQRPAPTCEDWVFCLEKQS